MKRVAAALALALCLAMVLPIAVGAGDAPLRGFSPSSIAAERAAETVVLRSPSEAAAERHEAALASYVHRMGSPGDYRSAIYVRDVLANAGWDAKLVTYDVPIAVPAFQELTLLGPVPKPVDLYEAEIPGDSFSRDHAAIGIPYSGYSNDGDVTGPVVYANYALPADFDELAKDGVDVRGAIVLARVGRGALTSKAFESAKHGASATFIFVDPMDNGYFKGDPYPAGPWRPTSASIRNTMTFTNAPGDPTAIGIPVPGAPHKPFSAIRLPSIPEMPVTADVARELIAAMGGPVAPAAWHGGFALPLHLGGGVRAHFVLKSKRTFGPIWDVIATLRGTDPEQEVVVGGHRDAWTYGAVDPISGTVDLVQLGVALAKAEETGWKPRRTIVIGSWDGEELNLFGSEIWVEQHEAQLRAGCVAYINTDEVAYGPTFGASATPDLSGLMTDAAQTSTAPDGSSLAAYWRAQDPKLDVASIGGGSDHEPFVFHENIPAAQGAFYGPFGTYHSAYDDIASLRVFDPGYHRAAAVARYTSLVVMRLADALAPDLRLADVGVALGMRLDAFEKVDASQRRAGVVAALRPAIAAFSKRAVAIDASVDAAVAAGDPAAAAKAYATLRAAENAFYVPAGIDGGWSRSLLFGEEPLPTLEATLDATHGDVALALLLGAIGAAPQPG
jgi:N-acetylated-alpha-linked acidic dipeptidase